MHLHCKIFPHVQLWNISLNVDFDFDFDLLQKIKSSGYIWSYKKNK